LQLRLVDLYNARNCSDFFSASFYFEARNNNCVDITKGAAGINKKAPIRGFFTRKIDFTTYY